MHITQNMFLIVINLAFLVYSIGIINEIKGNKLLWVLAILTSIPYGLMTLEYFIDFSFASVNILIYVLSPLVYVTYLMKNRTKNMLLLALPAFYLVFLAVNKLTDLGFTEMVYTLSALPIGLGVYNYFKDSSNEGKVAILLTIVLLRYFLIYAHNVSGI